ncbi:restriction endonuclease [Streptomyces sp. NPDC048279]|uniref:restriction endonuclease n=1 Tax=unclassified Streptomyces TaxID=2593676 RepID=UPI00341D3B73
MTDTELVVGEELTRRELHQRFGGTPQGGIAPSSASRMVMLFTMDSSPASDYTGWGDDGTFHFMGQGARGNQTMTQGNRSLLRHQEDNRSLHVFHRLPNGPTGGAPLYRHLGRFRLDDETPYYSADAPDEDGTNRNVIIFRLRPIGAIADGGPQLPRTPATTVRIVELQPTYQSRHTSETRPSRAHTEAQLVESYAAHLRASGRSLTQAQLTLAGETTPYRVDLLDSTENRLIEAKGSATRAAVREAIGKLLDFRRFFNPTPTLAVLLPSQPREDLLDLCASLCIEVVWPREDGGFVSTHD